MKRVSVKSCKIILYLVKQCNYIYIILHNPIKQCKCKYLYIYMILHGYVKQCKSEKCKKCDFYLKRGDFIMF
jgi:hypothetical protein